MVWVFLVIGDVRVKKGDLRRKQVPVCCERVQRRINRYPFAPNGTALPQTGTGLLRAGTALDKRVPVCSERSTGLPQNGTTLLRAGTASPQTITSLVPTDTGLLQKGTGPPQKVERLRQTGKRLRQNRQRFAPAWKRKRAEVVIFSCPRSFRAVGSADSITPKSPTSDPPKDGLTRSHPALSPSPLGSCDLCRGSRRAPFAVANLRPRIFDPLGLPTCSRKLSE